MTKNNLLIKNLIRILEILAWLILLIVYWYFLVTTINFTPTTDLPMFSPSNNFVTSTYPNNVYHINRKGNTWDTILSVFTLICLFGNNDDSSTLGLPASLNIDDLD